MVKIPLKTNIYKWGNQFKRQILEHSQCSLFNTIGNLIMSYRELNSYHEFISIPINERWTSCTVGLEHSVSGDYYWLTCSIRFYLGDESDLYIHIGRGSRSDADLVISTIEANGFKQTIKRFMREWEYFDFQRTSNHVKPESST